MVNIRKHVVLSTDVVSPDQSRVAHPWASGNFGDVHDYHVMKTHRIAVNERLCGPCLFLILVHGEYCTYMKDDCL